MHVFFWFEMLRINLRSVHTHMHSLQYLMYLRMYTCCTVDFFVAIAETIRVTQNTQCRLSTDGCKRYFGTPQTKCRRMIKAG